jgi:hypothetical protein
MSDDRFEQDEPKDEDVEAHKAHRKGTDEPTTSDDVEAHRHGRRLNEELASNELGANDESDDVEAHVKRR